MQEAASRNVFDDLEAEDERLEAILASLDEGSWVSPSAAPGWSIVDVVLHLAQTDEAVIQAVAGTTAPEPWASTTAATLDEIIAELDATTAPERAGRAMDRETEDAFERLRAAGYM